MSVSVVLEQAPMWKTASIFVVIFWSMTSVRNWSFVMNSWKERFWRFFDLASSPCWSTAMMSLIFLLFSCAIIAEPIKPAAPVTTIIYLSLKWFILVYKDNWVWLVCQVRGIFG